MTTNYKILRDLILKIEGETLEDELEFGCLIETISPSGFINESYVIETKDNKRGKLELIRVFNEEVGTRSIPKVGLHEILGKDIDLARVLRALGKVKGTTKIEIYEDGSMWTELGNLSWDLDHPLHLQSEETITKLTELLK